MALEGRVTLLTNPASGHGRASHAAERAVQAALVGARADAMPDFDQAFNDVYTVKAG